MAVVRVRQLSLTLGWFTGLSLPPFGCLSSFDKPMGQQMRLVLRKSPSLQLLLGYFSPKMSLLFKHHTCRHFLEIFHFNKFSRENERILNFKNLIGGWQRLRCWWPWTGRPIRARISSSSRAGRGTRSTWYPRTGPASVLSRCWPTSCRSSSKVNFSSISQFNSNKICVSKFKFHSIGREDNDMKYGTLSNRFTGGGDQRRR